MKSKRRSLYLLTLLGLSYSLNASGLEEKSVEETKLETISVVEQSETNFNFQEAMKSQPKNISELLKEEASIDIAGGSPNAKRFYMRGISEALTNITIDGAKQSKDLHQHRGGLSSIDTDILKSVSINPGVTAADQGAGNLGGNIKFETVDAQDLLQKGKNYGAFIKTTLGSIDDSYKNSLALYGKLDNNIGLLIYGNKADSDNYKTGSGREVLSSAEEVENYLVKLSMINLNSHSLRVSHEKNTQEGLYKFGSTGSDMGYLTNEDEAVPQKITRKTSILNYNFNPNDLVDTSVKLYKNDSDLERLDNDTKYSSEGEGADLRNIFTFGNDALSNKLTVGVDYEKEEGISSTGDVTSENKGVFAQNRMGFNDFNISFGARYDDFETDFIHKKFDGDEISANINGEYFFNDNFSLFAGYGESVSGANTIPVGWLTNISPNLKFNGSQNGTLEPQKAKKYETGTNLEFKELFSKDDSLKFKFTLFETKIEDAIVRNGGGGNPITDIINDDEYKTQGFEVRTSYMIDNFRTTLSYSHSDVKKDGQDLEGTTKRVAGSYGDKIVANFDYDVSKNLSFGYTIVGALKNNNPSSDDVNNKAGYAIHNLNASFTPQEFKNLTFSLAVNNVFDKDYTSHTSLVSNGEAVGEAGRDVRVSLRYKF